MEQEHHKKLMIIVSVLVLLIIIILGFVLVGGRSPLNTGQPAQIPKTHEQMLVEASSASKSSSISDPNVQLLMKSGTASKTSSTGGNRNALIKAGSAM